MKDQWFGTTLDSLWRSKAPRQPGFKVYIWNPSRCTVGDVVMGQAESPRYDITKWVISIDLRDNITFENDQDAVVSTATIMLQYDALALPIEITERTLLDHTPIRIYQGDERVTETDWVCVFTGILQGNPNVTEEGRAEHLKREITVLAADRAAAYANKRVTAWSYERGVDLGTACVETAVNFGGMDRREVRIGYQGYEQGQERAQLVDIEVIPGIYEMLFCVGKKPRFDCLGYLIAADSDLDKAPARVHVNKTLVVAVSRMQTSASTHNSVRLLGLDNKLTKVVEREKRLAHGSITSGFFEDQVRQMIYFSEDKGKDTAGRKARKTRLDPPKGDIHTLAGCDFGQEATWNAIKEEDGETEFGGELIFDTGSVPELRVALIVTWAATRIVLLLDALLDFLSGPVGDVVFVAVWILEAMSLLAILEAMSNMGRCNYEIWGEPVQNVYKQLCATAQMANLLTGDIREKEYRNDWIYDIDVLAARAKQMLKREIVKGWLYELTLIDDPLLDVDDIIQIVDRKYYVISIFRQINRRGQPVATMKVTAWRIA